MQNPFTRRWEFILSKRFFGILTFFNYVIADGIFELLKKSSIGIKTEYKEKQVLIRDKFNLSCFQINKLRKLQTKGLTYFI